MNTDNKDLQCLCCVSLKSDRRFLLIFIVSLLFIQKVLMPLKTCILSQNPPLAIMIRAPSMHQCTCHMGINQVRYHMTTLRSLIGQQLKRAYANAGAYHLHYKMVVCLLLIKSWGSWRGQGAPWAFFRYPPWSILDFIALLLRTWPLAPNHFNYSP